MESFYKLYSHYSGDSHIADAGMFANAGTSAQPSRIRVQQHVIEKKTAEGQHGLTPERIARITASAKQREYRERLKNSPVVPQVTKEGDGAVAPLHKPSGEQTELANGKACGASHIADDKECRNDMVKVKTDKPIGFRIAEIGPGGKEHNVQESPEWKAGKEMSNNELLGLIDNKHAKEMGDADREHVSVSEHKDSKDPVSKTGEPELAEKEVMHHSDPERLGIAVDVTDKLLNRFTVPADGWVHLAPFGKHPHPTGVVQVIDDKSVDAMVANFASRKASDKNFTGALLDFDHFSQSGDKPSEAGGWIENLAKRDDGMWGQVRWTDVGEKAVNGGRYRLVSPVWLKRNCEPVDNGQLRPLVLDSVALTNEPNLKGLTPISR